MLHPNFRTDYDNFLKNRENNEGEILIVGGSLSGLTCALACARYGIRTRILERVEMRDRTGGGLGVDRALLATVTGIDPRLDGELPHLPVVKSYRESTAWLLLHDWLRGYVLRNPLVTFEEGVYVREVRQTGEAAIVVTADGTEIMAPAILGADGYRSTVRRAVNPNEPYASYAGYMLWRGLVSERSISRSTRWPRSSEGIGMIDTAGYRLIAYPVPGKDGSLIPGERQMNFVWYDITRDDLLREKGCLSPEGYVLSTLNNEQIPPAVLDDLARIAEQIWPEPWKSAVFQSLADATLFGTPICEYLPELITRGRLAILGDAAHVSSPMTGRGFVTGVGDADSLARQLAGISANDPDGYFDALQRYGDNRLREARLLGATSKSASQQYLNMAGLRL